MRAVISLVTAVLVCSSALRTASAQSTDQAALSKQLSRGSTAERESAFEQAFRIPPSQRQDVLWQALIQELVRLNQELAQRRLARSVGAEMTPAPGMGEYYGLVLQAVIQCQCSRAIDALAGALGSGRGVINALVALGDEAVPAVVSQARAGGVRQASDALIALGEFLAGRIGISAESKRAIAWAAEERLHGIQHPLVLNHAMRVAAATGKPELRAIIRGIARSEHEVVMRGISDPADIRQVQRVASHLTSPIPE